MVVDVRRTNDAGGLARARAIRFEVFVDEQGVTADEELDDLDDRPGTVHLLAIDLATGEDLGTLRLLGERHQGVVHVTRVAVRRSARRGGVGRALMEAAETIALDDYGGGEPWVVSIELSVQESAIAFYESLGYEIGERRYLDAGMWHRDAVKVLEG